jgi:hypothetical protein
VIKNVVGKVTLGVFREIFTSRIVPFFNKEFTSSVTVYLCDIGNGQYEVSDNQSIFI